MKFSVISNDLQKALSKVISVVPSKSTLPILENILFELSGNSLRLTATDLEMYLTVEIAVGGQKDGRLAIPAKRLNETVRALPNMDLEITAEHATNKVTIKTEQGEYRMAGETAENFPVEVKVKGQASMELDASTLKGMVSKTLFAVSGDELRPAMMGVLFQWKESYLSSVSTDGHRLVRVILSDVAVAKTEREVIIPAKALNVLTKSLDTGTVTVTLGESNVLFEVGDFQLISRIIDERYPNYESVIPIDNDKRMIVNRQGLLSAVRRCALYSNSITNQVRLFLADGELRVSAEDMDFGGEAKEVVACQYKNEAMEIGFNAKYLEEALTHLDSEDAEFEFSSPTRAGILRPTQPPANQNILLLVMPVRLNA